MSNANTQYREIEIRAVYHLEKNRDINPSNSLKEKIRYFYIF